MTASSRHLQLGMSIACPGHVSAYCNDREGRRLPACPYTRVRFPAVFPLPPQTEQMQEAHHSVAYACGARQLSLHARCLRELACRHSPHVHIANKTQLCSLQHPAALRPLQEPSVSVAGLRSCRCFMPITSERPSSIASHVQAGSALHEVRDAATRRTARLPRQRSS